MPRTLLERMVFAVGLVATAGLIALIALTYRNSHSTARSAAASTPTRPVARAHASAVTAPPRPTATATSPAGSTSEAAAPPAPTSTRASISLTLTATRGDSWLEARAGSSNGRVLYASTLRAGSTETFRARRLWIRLGAAANLDARLGGVILHLPAGTYSTLVTRRGLGSLGP